MAARSVDSPSSGHDASAKEELLASLGELRDRLEVRTATALLELGALFDVEEPDAGMSYDIGRWRCMLFDYGRALDEELHERLQALARPKAEPKTMPQAWRELDARRRLDGCVGLLLAYAGMREPRTRSSHGFTDDMATDAIGSFAWWCCWALDTWEDERTLGARMGLKDIEGFVDSARGHLDGLDPGLLVVLVRLFPWIGE